jgi:hypothetical protein
MICESKTAFSELLYTSSAINGAYCPFLGFTYSNISVIVSENDFVVLECKFEIAILAANCA